MRLAFLLFLLGCFGTAHASWFGPKNYDECILKNMKGVTLRQAVGVIQNSCRAKFPEGCYAWEKEYGINQPSSTKKPWEKYANPYLASSYGESAPAAPDGCYAVLR